VVSVFVYHYSQFSTLVKSFKVNQDFRNIRFALFVVFRKLNSIFTDAVALCQVSFQTGSETTGDNSGLQLQVRYLHVFAHFASCGVKKAWLLLVIVRQYFAMHTFFVADGHWWRHGLNPQILSFGPQCWLPTCFENSTLCYFVLRASTRLMECDCF